jgi:hypothetical protein
MIVISMRLQDSYLCVNCDLIVDSATYCPGCGEGKSLHSLAKFINRAPDNSALLAITHSCQDEPRFACAACDSTTVAIH